MIIGLIFGLFIGVFSAEFVRLNEIISNTAKELFGFKINIVIYYVLFAVMGMWIGYFLT